MNTESKKTIIWLAFWSLILSLFINLINFHITKAVSDWDNLVEVTEDWVIYNSSFDTGFDLGDQPDILPSDCSGEANTGESADFVSNWSDMRFVLYRYQDDNDNWNAVILITNDIGHDITFEYDSENDHYYYRFYVPEGVHFLHARASLGGEFGTDVQWECMSDYVSETLETEFNYDIRQDSIISDVYYGTEIFRLYNSGVDYPEGYEGLEIPIFEEGGGSEWDNAVNVTSTLQISNETTSLDVTDDWAEYISDCSNSTVRDNFENRNFTNVRVQAPSNYGDFSAQIQQVYVEFTTNETPSDVEFDTVGADPVLTAVSNRDNNYDWYRIWYTGATGSVVQVTCGANSGTDYQISTEHYQPEDFWVGSRVYFSDWPITYPEDYAGLIIPTTPGGAGTLYHPEFEYFLDGLHFRGTYVGNIPYESPGLERLTWRVYDDSDTELFSYTGVSGESFNYDFSGLGEYSVTLDYDIAPPGLVPDGWSFGTRTLNFTVDGNSLVGNTQTDTIDPETGEHSPGSTFEDCTTYGLDLIEGGMCLFRNLMSGLRAMFIYLFVPKTLETQVASFFDLLQHHLGILVYPFTVFPEFWTSLVAPDPNCSFVFTPAAGGLFSSDHPWQVDFCFLEDAPDSGQNTNILWGGPIFYFRMILVVSLLYALYSRFRHYVRTIP